MPFQAKEFLESQLVKPGTYTVKLMRYDHQLGGDGRTRLLLEFELHEDEGKTIVEWWDPENELAIRRAIQVLKIVDPSALERSFDSSNAFLEYAAKKLVELSEKDQWIKAVIVVGTKRDGTPVARFKQFLGLASVGKKTDAVPF